MEESKSLKEVYEILINSTTEVNKNIPYKFKRYLYRNMDKEYSVDIEPKKPIDEQNISDRAKNILGLIYRDYLVDTEKRQTLIKKEIEDAKKDKYNPDNLFKERNKINKENKELALMEYKKDNIFKRIIKFIKTKR